MVNYEFEALGGQALLDCPVVSGEGGGGAGVSLMDRWDERTEFRFFGTIYGVYGYICEPNTDELYADDLGTESPEPEALGVHPCGSHRGIGDVWDYRRLLHAGDAPAE